MGNGIGAVVPGDMLSRFELSTLLQIPTREEGEKPLLERLPEDAACFLKDVGKNMPHATVEVRGDVIILYGMAECGTAVYPLS